MGRFNKELHEALENLDGNEFTRGKTVGSTLKNFNGIHIISVVTFTKGTEGSTVVVTDINGDVVKAESNGTYKLHEEVYTVTNSKEGYFSKTTTITIEQADITAGTKAVTLEALTKYCVVTFTSTTAGSAIVVKDINGDVVTAESNGTYKLHDEAYTVTNSKAGYFSKTTTITIEQADITAGTKAVTLDALVKFCAVTFTAKDSVTGDPITGFTLIVKKGEDTVAAIDGVYNLAADTYAYTISKEDYATQTDIEFVISSEEVTNGTKAIEVSLVANE